MLAEFIQPDTKASISLNIKEIPSVGDRVSIQGVNTNIEGVVSERIWRMIDSSYYGDSSFDEQYLEVKIK